MNHEKQDKKPKFRKLLEYICCWRQNIEKSLLPSEDILHDQNVAEHFVMSQKLF